MARITLIALVSITGSIIMIIGMTMYELVGVTPLTYSLIVIGSILDVLLDTICVALSLNINNAQYQSLCSGCDSGLKWCCIKLADQTTRKKEMELAAMHRHRSSAAQGREEPISCKSTKKQSIQTHLDGPPTYLSATQWTPTDSIPTSTESSPTRSSMKLAAMHRHQTPVVQGQDGPMANNQTSIPRDQTTKTQSAEIRLQRGRRTTSTMDLLAIVQGQQEPTPCHSPT